YIFVFFFFQAEDGIRDKLVTGVQTCALPIYRRLHRQHQGRLLFTTLDRGALLRQLVTDLQSRRPADRVRIHAPGTAADLRDGGRSEERRVGKECRSRRETEHEKKKDDESGEK